MFHYKTQNSGSFKKWEALTNVVRVQRKLMIMNVKKSYRKNLEVFVYHTCVCVCVCVCVRLCVRVCVQALSCVWLLTTPQTVARQAPLSMGLSQAGILEWVAFSSSRGFSRPRDQTLGSSGSYIVRQILYHWVTWEAFYLVSSLNGHCSSIPFPAKHCFSLSLNVDIWMIKRR